MDIGLKIAIGAGVSLATAGLIVNPNGKQKEAAALNMFDKSWKELSPQEQKAVEFKAGHERWVGFFEKSVFPLTRKLPGANNPIMNPYKDAGAGAQGGDEDDE